MSEADGIFFEIHCDLPREAPGDSASTLRALQLMHELPDAPRVLDVGCGPGAQTIELLLATNGTVHAVDTHAPFLKETRRRADAAGAGDRLTTVEASMTELPFEDGAFDVIWSEGAIYIMGFDAGLAEWRRLIAPRGFMAVTELTWMTDDPPTEAVDFWVEGYPAMRGVDANLAAAVASGYELIDWFPLSAASWFDGYYDPLEARIDSLAEKYVGDAAALGVLEGERREIELYRAHGDSYAYVFYVMRRND